MTQELAPIDVSTMPELRRLVEDVQRTQRTQRLTVDSEEVAVLMPAKKPRRRSYSRARPVTEDDPLFRLIGIGRSGTPSNASEHKHEALDEAYRSLHHS
ncbi:MAG TPA: hypothetical protein VMU55_00875 [Solirubrobacteraceae bacterium]|nr:hypothetical protein [Solirubrobacteraceae bacterium]